MGQQITDGVGLAGSRRTVEEDAAFEVLARGLESLTVLGYLDHVLFDLVQDRIRQHELRPFESGSRQEPQEPILIALTGTERQDLAPEHTVVDRQLTELSECRGDELWVWTEELSFMAEFIGPWGSSPRRSSAIFLVSVGETSRGRTARIGGCCSGESAKSA